MIPLILIIFRENLIRGIRMGVIITNNSSLIFDVHDVFFDENFDNEIDQIRTMGIEFIANF